MNNTMNFRTLNIREYLRREDKIGETDLNQLISDFVCPPNPDVEGFLKNNAIEFTKKNQSVTYLVFTEEDVELVGYFTLAIKPIMVNAGQLSNTMRRKIARVSEFDEKSNTYSLSAYLIAQLGKNFADGANFRITGQQLLEVAMTEVLELQFRAGGMVVFLETENNDKLLNFYDTQNGFKQFETRETKAANKEPHTLIQMLKTL